MSRIARREWLEQCGAGGLLAVGAAAPALWRRAADAAPVDRAAERKLVVIELNGGNDGLNTIVPRGDDQYYKSRPGLAVAAANVIKLNDDVGLNDALKPLKSIFDRGELTIAQGVGYPNPNRSHFLSMDIWQTGDTTLARRRDGWLGRAIEAGRLTPGETPAMAIGLARPPLALATPAAHVPAVRDLAELELRVPSGWAGASDALEAIASIGPRGGSELDFVRSTASSAYISARRVKDLARIAPGSAHYPEDAFAGQLKLTAQLLKAGATQCVYYASLGSFDTHARQKDLHLRLLGQLAGALSAFWKDMEDAKLTDRVLVVLFSEFGRRVAENGSGGTDHGAAGPMLLLGAGGAGGLIGPRPDLSDLEDGDLKFSIDFRSVYAAVLEGWLGVKSEPVLGGRYSIAPVLG